VVSGAVGPPVTHQGIGEKCVLYAYLNGALAIGDGAASSLEYLPETVRNSRLLAPASLANAVAEKGSKRVRIGRRQMLACLPSSGKFLLRQGSDHWDLLDADNGYLVPSDPRVSTVALSLKDPIVQDLVRRQHLQVISGRTGYRVRALQPPRGK
jgi:hypothetical protein